MVEMLATILAVTGVGIVALIVALVSLKRESDWLNGEMREMANENEELAKKVNALKADKKMLERRLEGMRRENE